ncbi:gallate 1-beta-glucosyltransferase [Cajanus cajan]|uniref:Glycosyltransferase n=1 Tax=Cajanus cajan TaxID=3821 RepID=A0A151RRC3_CAJCA|nr:gallate 1-beta-glucosyltransferase [Cajanus cajan]KYP45100.1 Limonoid UDP-glucosyltransferase [Cajanus cajan]
MGNDVVHVLLVSFPGQGHVNPLLRLGKWLASKGLLVTFCTPQTWGKQMREGSDISEEAVGEGFLRFECFEDGWSDDDPRRQDLEQYLPQLEKAGKQALPSMIRRHAQKGPPVACLINNPFIPWVTDVAESLSLPSAMLWVQSCASFSAYYHYHHKLIPFPSQAQPHLDVQLPCMPLLTHHQVPTFLHPSTPEPFLGRAILQQLSNLEKTSCILMDTFQELEADVLDYMSKICHVPIKTVGPLFKASESVHGESECMIKWLDSKEASSVVYVSFGSVVHLKQEQVDEIAHGLLESGLCFLWVMKPPQKHSGKEAHVVPHGFLEKAGNKGKVVQWCRQEQVLGHPSISCFLTHCGWNSSVEALTFGVPLVAFPQWGDQVTNAKYLVDVFQVGVRMCWGEAANELIKRDEVMRCLFEATLGPMKQNALNFKAAAEAAVAQPAGSSHRNMDAFVDQLSKRSLQILKNYANAASLNSPSLPI